MAGKIVVHTGPMGCGKTLALLNVYYNSLYAGFPAYLGYPIGTSRYGANEIISRAFGAEQFISAPALELSRVYDDSVNWVRLVNLKNSFIGLDEAQFFEDPYFDTILNGWRENDNMVHISGLDMTYSCKPFGVIPIAMAVADTVNKYTGLCFDCREPAQLSWYTGNHKDSANNIEHIGDTEYLTLCVDCYMYRRKERATKEAEKFASENQFWF